MDVLTLAFSADPIERWLYPDPHEYLKNFRIFLKAFTAKTFEAGTAYHVDSYAGTALWLPPNSHPDDESIIAALEETVDKQTRTDSLEILEQMDRYHPPEPHWYLAIMGVDIAHQGQGYGSLLLKHTLALCDRDHASTYLESTNPKNIPLYERHGFELLGTIQIGTVPPLFPMLRKPR